MIPFDVDFCAICRIHGVREPAYQDVAGQWAYGVESLTEFLKRMKPERPHWFAIVTDDSVTEAAIFDLTAQGQYARENGQAATAEMLAKHGLKLGQVKQAPKDSAETVTGQNNPWSDKFAGDDKARQARIASILKSGGTALAASLAKAAGKRIDGRPLLTK